MDTQENPSKEQINNYIMSLKAQIFDLREDNTRIINIFDSIAKELGLERGCTVDDIFEKLQSIKQ